MPLFQKRQASLPFQSATIGGTVNFEVTRDFHIEAIIAEVRYTLDGQGTGVTNPYGGVAMLKKMTVQTNDGQNNRNVVSASGISLLNLAVNEMGNIDYRTRTAITNGLVTNGNHTVFVPYYFTPPQLTGPTRSAFLLPAPRFNTNINVSIQIANSVDLNTILAPNISGIQVRLHVIRRVVDIASWVTYDQEFNEVEDTFTSTGAGQIHELDVPGSYTGIVLTPLSPFQPANYMSVAGAFGWDGEISIQALDTTFQRISPGFLAAQNELTLAPMTANGLSQSPVGSVLQTLPASFRQGSLYFDFLTDQNGSSVSDLGSVLDANPYVATGSRIKLGIDIATALKLKIATRRIFGDLSPFKLSKKDK